MKKLTKKSDEIWFRIDAHNMLVLKPGKYTFQEVFDDMLDICSEDIDKEYIKSILLEELNKMIKTGSISCSEDGIYQNNIFKKEETKESTL